jgi:hypothetical protein
LPLRMDFWRFLVVRWQNSPSSCFHSQLARYPEITARLPLWH